jgi:hypothetical protein
VLGRLAHAGTLERARQMTGIAVTVNPHFLTHVVELEVRVIGAEGECRQPEVVRRQFRHRLDLPAQVI